MNRHRIPHMLSNQQFRRTQCLASRLAGIELVERHQELLAHRGRRRGIRDSGAWDSLLGAAEQGETAAVQQLLCLLTTKFTGFFRHSHHFGRAAEHALRAAQQRGEARLWSAAAATGEEPYSLAMALIEAFGTDRPPVTILATDVDVEALAVAERGEYATMSIQALALEGQEGFFTGAEGRASVRLKESVRRLVEFRPLNLAAVTWTVSGPFEVIFAGTC